MLARLDHDILGPPASRAGTPQINEGEAFKVTMRALDATLALTTPTTMRYRIDDINQGTVIQDWTSLTPSTSASFIVTSAQNAIRNGLNKERRQIVMEASDSDGPLRKTLDFDVLNLQGIT